MNSVAFMTTWETFQLDPWIAVNESDSISESFAGWHTLVIQIADDAVSYYIDGESTATHGEDFYPEVPMSINYNLWFVNGGLARSDEQREYIEQIDWVYFAGNTVLEPEEIEAQVEVLRDDDMTFIDTVPEWDPPLESPCNF